METPRPPEPTVPAEPGGPPAPPAAGTGSGTAAWPPPARRTGALAGLRADLRRDVRPAAVLVGVLLLVGAGVGVLWQALAPRADYRVVDGGAVAIGNPSPELLAAVDGVYVVSLAVVGILAGAVAWLLRRHRGLVVLLALALGTVAASVVAWQVGHLLAPGPTAAQLADVGARVTTGVRLRSLPALAVAPLLGTGVYVVAALFSHEDDLGREDPTTPVDDHGVLAADTAGHADPTGNEPMINSDAAS